MSRYIDSNLCEDYFYEHLDDNGMAGAMNAIREIPTADVRENVHGEWMLDNSVFGFPKWDCSNCKGEGRGDYSFCPNCGAIMDRR